MQIVAISDTHENFYSPESMPPGDVLIHAGDFTNIGSISAIRRFAVWLDTISSKYNKILVIAGNHDVSFERNSREAKWTLHNYGPANLCYLQDGQFDFQDKKFYGSPWQPEFGCNWAFNLPRGEQLAQKWSKVPENTDILITHGPPFGILDPGRGEDNVGCKDLAIAVTEVIRPRLHIFGHCHSGTGRIRKNSTLYINAAACDESHKLVNPPQIIQLP